jgi:hypothetical protein
VLPSSGADLPGGHLRQDKYQSMRLRLRAALRDPPDIFAPEDESRTGFRRVLLRGRTWRKSKEREILLNTWSIYLSTHFYILQT